RLQVLHDTLLLVSGDNGNGAANRQAKTNPRYAMIGGTLPVSGISNSGSVSPRRSRLQKIRNVGIRARRSAETVSPADAPCRTEQELFRSRKGFRVRAFEA